MMASAMIASQLLKGLYGPLFKYHYNLIMRCSDSAYKNLAKMNRENQLSLVAIDGLLLAGEVHLGRYMKNFM